VLGRFSYVRFSLAGHSLSLKMSVPNSPGLTSAGRIVPKEAREDYQQAEKLLAVAFLDFLSVGQEIIDRFTNRGSGSVDDVESQVAIYNLDERKIRAQKLDTTHRVKKSDAICLG
jgi:hypothetical protein